MQGKKSDFFSAWEAEELFGGRQPLYSEAGVFSLQTTHFPQHRLGLPPQDPAYSSISISPFLLRLATASFTRLISVSTPAAKAAQFSFFAICIAFR